MNRTAYDMALVLESKGVGVVGKNIFATIDIPPKPDNLVFITDIGAEGPDQLFFWNNSSTDMSHESFQVVARGEPGGINKNYDIIMAVKNALHRLETTYNDRKAYVQTLHKSGPIELRMDDTMRPFIAMTFTTKISFFNNRVVKRCLNANIIQRNSTTGKIKTN